MWSVLIMYFDVSIYSVQAFRCCFLSLSLVLARFCSFAMIPSSILRLCFSSIAFLFSLILVHFTYNSSISSLCHVFLSKNRKKWMIGFDWDRDWKKWSFDNEQFVSSTFKSDGKMSVIRFMIKLEDGELAERKYKWKIISERKITIEMY